MHITFVSNYINHHQLPLSEELFRLTEGNYTFLQTEPMTEERIKMGWDAELSKRPYVQLMSDNEEKAKQLILDSDVVIFGGAEDQSLIIPRLEAGKFTIRYSERLYKTGRWKFVSPRGLKQKYYDHIRFRNYPVYMLCAGAYVAGDFRLIHAYPDKLVKFGYFPEFREYRDVHEFRKNNKNIEILWAARFIDWKHPEMMISLATGLAGEKYDFHVTMVGDGELLEQTKAEVISRGLDDFFTFTGAKKPEEVREMMLASDIFVSTSDSREGWGAVVNEAMNSGCVTIAAKEIGATPWMIRDGINGYTYKACHKEGLYHKVVSAIEDAENRRLIGTRAYEAIKENWCPEVAAKRLFAFINDKEHAIPDYEDGPMSKA